MALSTTWQWLNDNGSGFGVIVGVLAVCVALLPIVWAVLQFIRIKKADNQRVQFTTFHNLIKQLVEGDEPNQIIRVDRQIAVVFELRSFNRYYPVTLRILKGLKNEWARPGMPVPHQRLIAEIDLAISEIEKRV